MNVNEIYPEIRGIQKSFLDADFCLSEFWSALNALKGYPIILETLHDVYV